MLALGRERRRSRKDSSAPSSARWDFGTFRAGTRLGNMRAHVLHRYPPRTVLFTVTRNLQVDATLVIIHLGEARLPVELFRIVQPEGTGVALPLQFARNFPEVELCASSTLTSFTPT